MPAKDANRELPLTPATLHVLLSLADSEKHGYAIIQEVAARTGGEVQLGAGTLYALVKRLLEGGLIDESGDRPDPSMDDERRRYYRLTAFGRDVAIAEVKRLEDVVRQARAVRLFGRGMRRRTS
jgi:DNA-binding PadR family transcriptional regulator